LSSPKVAVLILNYKRFDDTVECVESVLQSDYDNYEIILIDNDSRDDSARRIAQKFPTLELIANPVNVGYAEGNNIGMRRALDKGAEYVFVLNNDTTLEPDAIRKLVQAGEADKAATIIAPKICFYDDKKMINSCGTRMDWFKLRPHKGACFEKDQGQYTAIEEKEIFPGAAFLFKKELFEKVGYFDARFFLIHEDAEICLRNRARGFKNIIVPSAAVYHKVSRTLSAYPFLTEYYSTRNLFFLGKLMGTCTQKIQMICGLAAFSLKRGISYPFADARGKQRIAGYFAGVLDFIKGKMGPYQAE
jgi:GT2 family glycosyltransferase